MSSSRFCCWVTDGSSEKEYPGQNSAYYRTTRMYSISDPMTNLLESAHTLTGMPWWMTLVVGGAGVRASLVPLTLKGQHATEVVMSAFSRASRDVEIRREKEMNTGKDSTLELVQLARHYVEERRTLEKNTPSPIWMVLSPVAQISVLVYGLYSVRSMATHGWPGFESGGPWWAVDLTLPAVDWITMSAPLGSAGIIMPGLLMTALHLSIRNIRPKRKKDNVSEQVQIREWALSNLAMVLELCTIPVAIGVLSMPQATLYYWTTGMYSSLVFQALSKRRMSEKLSPEAESLLRQAAQWVSEHSPEKADSLLRQALVLHPQNRSIHIALGQVSSSLQAWKDAEYHYDIVAEGHHKDLLEQQALFGCAMALLQVKGRRDDAIEKLKRAAAYADERFKPLAVRSLVALAMLTKSPVYARKALAMDPSCSSSVKPYLVEDSASSSSNG